MATETKFKAIKITEKNADKIQAAIDAVQGPRCEVNILDHDDVARKAGSAEKRLDNILLPKKYRAGASFTSRAGGCGVTAYKYAQGSTGIELERRGGGWFLVNVFRDRVWPDQRSLDDMTLSAEQVRIFEEKSRKAMGIYIRYERPELSTHSL